MPKRSDVEGGAAETEMLDIPANDAVPIGKEKSKKQLGRLKRKKAVAEVIAGGSGHGPETISAQSLEGIIEPELKRTKSDHGDHDARMEMETEQ